MRHVILVDKKNNEIGTEEKIKTHKEGLLHRAFSIFVFNRKGELLLQQRTKQKYHSGGKWSNTCCSHPTPGNDITTDIHKRLKEEMGFDCELNELFTFVYKTKLGNLFEHELDHVFIGKYDGDPEPNPEEVEDWRWTKFEDVKNDVELNPDDYSYWFKILINSSEHRKTIEKYI